jgi:hypothetical protein
MPLKNTWATGESYDNAAQNSVATQVNTNTTNIATNTANIGLKANAASPSFMGTPSFASGIPATEIPSGITNGNTALQSQVVVSATSYYITNSNLNLPNPMKVGLVVGSRFRWTIAMAKTAAGTGTFQIKLYRGTNGSTADTADVTQTIGTQTAVVDNMTVDVEIVVTTIGAAGAYFWSIIPTNKAITATGFGVATGPTGQFSGTVSGVALNTAALKFGIGFVATTGTPTITVPMVRAQALNVM